MSFFELVLQAGPILWVILALSVVVVYVFILQLQTLTKLRSSKALVAKVHASLMQQDPTGALEHTAEKSLGARVLRVGLERVTVSLEAIQGAMSEAVLHEEDRLMRPVDTLGIVAQIAPLLGLLGTVIGMVRSFLEFANTAAPTPSQLSTGISEALINTAAGLIVAIVSYVARAVLRARAMALLAEADRMREALPNWVREAVMRGQGKLQGDPIPPFEPREPA